jgi:hypothetical protein
MVAAVSPIPVGNALRVQLAPPVGATFWKLFRNTTNVFTGPTDTASTLVTNSNEPVIYDVTGLSNGTTYYYAASYWNGAAWTSDAAGTPGVPASSYVDQSTDALTLLRDRVDAGLANEIALAHLTPGENANGLIAVLTAPPIFEQVQFPVVVVHLTNEAPAEYGLGEEVADDYTDPMTGLWTQNEGYFARTQISVTGWTLNPDARIALRKSLRAVMIANNQVFATAGLREVVFSQTDEDELSGTYGAPVYFTVGTFSCLSPLAVGGQVAPITDVTVAVNAVHAAFSETVSLGRH